MRQKPHSLISCNGLEPPEHDTPNLSDGALNFRMASWQNDTYCGPRFVEKVEMY